MELPVLSWGPMQCLASTVYVTVIFLLFLGNGMVFGTGDEDDRNAITYTVA